MLFKNYLLFFSFLLLTCPAFAQEQLAEGTLTYAITITGKIPTPANEPALTETKSGTMTIYIKDDNVRQDIRLEDGYTHSQISNYATGKNIILQTINTIHYAIETSLKEEHRKNAAFFNARLEPGTRTKKIAGGDATEARLRYKDGSVFDLYYLGTYELKYPEVFDHMPELHGIPAEYDITMSNGFTTHFELISIDPGPVANALFRVPEGYRIINRKEYDKMLR